MIAKKILPFYYLFFSLITVGAFAYTLFPARLTSAYHTMFALRLVNRSCHRMVRCTMPVTTMSHHRRTVTANTRPATHSSNPHWLDSIKKKRREGDTIPTTSSERRWLMILFAVNASIYGLWQLATPPAPVHEEFKTETNQPKESKNPPEWSTHLHAWLNRHFVCSIQAVRDGRWWVLGTSTLSHPTTLHLLANSITMHAFASMAVPVLGWKKFASAYIVTALSGHAAFFAEKADFVWDEPQQEYAVTLPVQCGTVGASGVVCGLEGIVCALFPMSRLYLVGLVPMRMWMAATGSNAVDLWCVSSRSNQEVAHSAHLGGFVCGILLGLLVRFRRGGKPWQALLDKLYTLPNRQTRFVLPYRRLV
jgi:membrane associated rhomboid family serine protease